jgi:hypothetical protein
MLAADVLESLAGLREVRPLERELASPSLSWARKSSTGRNPSTRWCSWPAESRISWVGVHFAPKRSNVVFWSRMWARAGTKFSTMNSATFVTG